MSDGFIVDLPGHGSYDVEHGQTWVSIPRAHSSDVVFYDVDAVAVGAGQATDSVVLVEQEEGTLHPFDGEAFKHMAEVGRLVPGELYPR
jgi:hypothetical protein